VGALLRHRGQESYLKSYATVAFAIISNSSFFVENPYPLKHVVSSTHLWYGKHKKPVTWPQFDEENMTIGIGIVCDGGETILLSCDKRASYGNPPSLVTDSCGKLFASIEGKFYVVIAGTVNACQMFEGYLAEHLKQFNGQIPSLDAAKTAMLDARTRLHSVLSDDQLRRELAISLEQVHGSPDLSRQTMRQARKIIREIDVPIEVIAGGFASAGGIILAFSRMSEIQETTTPGFHIIGSGGELAHSWLCFRNQDVHMTAARSYWHLREAMFFASINPTVSKESICVAIRKAGVFPLERAQEYVNDLSKAFYPKLTQILDGEEALTKFKNAFAISHMWG
jgi:hypothetical protein